MASALTPMPSFSLGSQAPCLGVGCQACLSPHLLYLSPSVLQGSGGTGTGTDTEGFSSLMVNSSHRGCDLSGLPVPTAVDRLELLRHRALSRQTENQVSLI